jgi:hypothetical protein
MDFKALISKIESIDGKIETPAAPTLPQSVQLNEDAELRVLAGTSSYITEAKKKAEEKKEEKEVKEAEDRLPAKKKETTWTDKSGKKHPATQVQGSQSRKADKEAEKESKKDESIEPKFKSKFMKMVEAKKAEKDEKKKESKKKKMEEAAKPDFLDVDGDGNKKEPMKKAAADKGGDKKDGKKGMSAKQEKYFGKKNESVKTSKKVVAESVEQPMSFKEMMKLVVESGGQQAIDPLDQELFAWATRVAKNKLGEGIKSEVYAGMVYERMGGRFEMYDVLSEDQK